MVLYFKYVLVSAVSHPNVKPMAYANSLLSLFGQCSVLSQQFLVNFNPLRIRRKLFVRVFKYLGLLEHHFNDRNITLTDSRPSLKTETSNHNNNKYRTLVTSIFLEIFKMKLCLVMVMCPQIRMIINYFKDFSCKKGRKIIFSDKFQELPD